VYFDESEGKIGSPALDVTQPARQYGRSSVELRFLLLQALRGPAKSGKCPMSTRGRELPWNSGRYRPGADYCPRQAAI
jgi:hypothetical protein